MPDYSSPATTQLRADLVAALDLDSFDPSAYDDPEYLQAALEVHPHVGDLARAHCVAERTLYRALERHDIAHEQPPKHGPARALWDAAPDTIPGDD
ncbi:hypothetical protein [Haloarcula halophila]|uniref:hypothetical protein n=1 Tax=Halomicroarcula sp. GCM10025335 TaxID=3252668 RepID=UPI0036192D88